MKIPRLAIHNYQFTLVLVFLVAIMGLVSYNTMPKSEDPAIEFNMSTILIINPGASPEDMETLIVNPIEEEINELEDIKNVKTEITNGVASFKIELEYGIDSDNKHREIVQIVNELSADLPETIVRTDLEQPSVFDVSIMQLAITSPDASPAQLKKTSEDLKDKLENSAGVRAVELDAEQDLEIKIKCDLEKMSHYKMSLGQVMMCIQDLNRSIPGGSIKLGNKEFNIESSGLYEDLDQIRNTVISSGNNQIIKLKEIATVTYDYEKKEEFATYNGQAAVWLSVQQKEGMNIYDVTEGVDKRIEEFSKHVQADISIVPVFKQADSVKARLGQFTSSFLQGILIVGIIVFLAVGFRASVVVMLSIPLSILTGIGLIDVSGFGLQQMTIAGLIIALGMLVDNSIAIVENINRFIKKGLSPVEAAIKGASEIGMALVSSTATTVLAFAPMLMMGNDVGDFIKSMILIVVFTLLASLVIALTFAPFISSRVLKKQEENKKTVLLDQFIDKYYQKWVKGAINRPVFTLIAGLVIFFGSISLMPFIGVSFFPKAEKNQLLVNIITPEGSNLDHTNKAIKYAESVLKNHSYVESIAASVGMGNPQAYYNMDNLTPAVNKGQLLAILGEYDFDKVANLIKELRTTFATYSGARLEVKEFGQGPPVDSPIEVRLFSDDLEELKAIAADVEQIISKSSATININNPLAEDQTSLKIKINYEKAGMLGINIIDIDMTVRAAINGLSIGSFQDNLGDEYEIVVESNMVGAPEIPSLDRIFITSQRGGQIPLSQVSELIFDKNIKRIDHYDLERFITVSADVDETVMSIAKVTSNIIEQLKQYNFPTGSYFSLGGEQENRDESFGGLGQALIIALLGIFAVLVLQFRSFSQPLIVFSAIPLSISGAFIALLITGYSFSFMAFVGLTSLMGIVVNSSIILVDYANQKRMEGLNTLEAVTEAAKTRFTPIILTTITTIAGLLPLTISGGKMWAPMGWAIIGGLVLSTGLTLLIVPVLYNLLTKD